MFLRRPGLRFWGRVRPRPTCRVCGARQPAPDPRSSERLWHDLELAVTQLGAALYLGPFCSGGCQEAFLALPKDRQVATAFGSRLAQVVRRHQGDPDERRPVWRMRWARMPLSPTSRIGAPPLEGRAVDRRASWCLDLQTDGLEA